MYFGGVLLKPGHPGPSWTPFLTGLSGPAPLTSKRHPKTDLQAPRDHQGRGTSLRRPFGTLRGSSNDVSMVANASQRIFGAHSRKTEIATIPEHLETFSEH
ncbi:hypothetical protein CDL15_Pgr011315 [Punica granatum]|uniref:Uncharacterized protein n=1 Tax=Punica granatum TaxID=22663 RepID=A0A218WFC9_PUNGR|nr:hypothetical protein CDL15_Pgr011315 [Punica granatum]PKI56392.1 hypothetical protein CRG98_023195 [Punica granatum]